MGENGGEVKGGGWDDGGRPPQFPAAPDVTFLFERP